MNEGRFDPSAIVRILRRHHVQFVVIGGIAGQLWGSPTITQDLDICYSREKLNLERLAAALKALNARLRGVKEKVPFRLDAATLASGDRFTFETDVGDLDCLGAPMGTNGYEDLKQAAKQMNVGGITIEVTSVDDLMRMKRAAGRPKDRIEVEILGAVRDERTRRKRRE